VGKSSFKINTPSTKLQFLNGLIAGINNEKKQEEEAEAQQQASYARAYQNLLPTLIREQGDTARHKETTGLDIQKLLQGQSQFESKQKFDWNKVLQDQSQFESKQAFDFKKFSIETNTKLQEMLYDFKIEKFQAENAQDMEKARQSFQLQLEGLRAENDLTMDTEMEKMRQAFEVKLTGIKLEAGLEETALKEQSATKRTGMGIKSAEKIAGEQLGLETEKFEEGKVGKLTDAQQGVYNRYKDLEDAIFEPRYGLAALLMAAEDKDQARTLRAALDVQLDRLNEEAKALPESVRPATPIPKLGEMDIKQWYGLRKPRQLPVLQPREQEAPETELEKTEQQVLIDSGAVIDERISFIKKRSPNKKTLTEVEKQSLISKGIDPEAVERGLR